MRSAVEIDSFPALVVADRVLWQADLAWDVASPECLVRT